MTNDAAVETGTFPIAMEICKFAAKLFLSFFASHLIGAARNDSAAISLVQQLAMIECH